MTEPPFDSCLNSPSACVVDLCCLSIMADGDRRHDRSFAERSDRSGPSTSLPLHLGQRLPFFLPWVPRPAAGAADGLPSPPVLTESCGFKLIMGTVGGEEFNVATIFPVDAVQFNHRSTNAGGVFCVSRYLRRLSSQQSRRKCCTCL